MMDGKLELTPEFYAMMFEVDNFAELRTALQVFQIGIPILWILALIILWRVNSENCIRPATRGYKIYILALLILSCLTYFFTFLLSNLLLVLGALMVSALISVASNYSVLAKYREEYLK